MSISGQIYDSVFSSLYRLIEKEGSHPNIQTQKHWGKKTMWFLNAYSFENQYVFHNYSLWSVKFKKKKGRLNEKPQANSKGDILSLQRKLQNVVHAKET